MLLCCLLAGSVCAQTLQVKAPKSVAEGNTFRVSFVVSDKASDFRGPSFKGFSVLSGPSTSYSSSTTINNGKMTSNVEYSFQYYIMADAEGSYQIGSASCVTDGKRVYSEPFTIKVTKGSGGSSYGSGSQGNSGRTDSRYDSREDEKPQVTGITPQTLYARASVNKTHPYKGEQVIVTYKIYTQVSLQNFQLDKLPGNKGFWTEDLSEGKQIKSYDEIIGGKKFRVAEIRRGAMFAQESGQLKIEPLTLDVLALVPRQRRRTGTIFDLFDDPFFSTAQAVEKELRTNSLTLNVKPLPAAPANYSGGVGLFTVGHTVDLNHVRANEAITYRVTVSGNGNLMLLENPHIDFSKVFDVYDPKIIDNIKRTDAGISGSRTFEFVIVPQSDGEFEIPALNFVFFNPATGKYETLHKPAIPIKVSKGAPDSRTAAGQNEVEQLNNDINHIKTHAAMHANGRRNHPSALQWSLLIVILAGGIAVTVIGRKRQAMMADEQNVRFMRATSLAKKRLRAAEKYLSTDDTEHFYEEVYKALWGCLSDKYGIELSQLSQDTVESKLLEKKVAQETKDSIMKLAHDVNFARFAPGDPSAMKQRIYDEAIQTIILI